MDFIFILLLLNCLISFIQPLKFAEESPYLLVRIMDLKLYEWKPDSINKIEKVLDSELKYTDEKKGTECKSVFFEQEAAYPKPDGRFLDLSIRGTCVDDNGEHHVIDKDLLTKAIIRKIDEVNLATSAIVFRIGNVQVYSRTRNKLNLIIIPTSVGLVVFLFILTFCLREMRAKQKRQHIISELQKKKDASEKKALIIPNVDPLANDKQRLLQLDPTVVGNVSDTMGSPKEFTMEQYSPLIRLNNKTAAADNRFYQGTSSPPVIPPKENRSPYLNRDNEASFQTQRPSKPSRENMPIQYENESPFLANHSPYKNDQQYLDMISLQEQNPRVVVRSIRDDGSYPAYHQQQHEDSSQKFVSIPVHVEHSAPYQRYVSNPYHSDPYYPHTNA